MTRSLITGIGGFVASHLAEYLIGKGEDTWGTYRWNEDLSRIEKIRKLGLVPMDILDLYSCVKAIKELKPDYIYHLAAQSYVPDSFTYPGITVQTNTLGTLNVLEAIRFAKDNFNYSPMIHVCSSSEVYGQVKKKDIPIKETQPFNPANSYAIGKIGADMFGLLYFKNYGLKIIRTRMFTHTGPRRTMLSAEVNFAKQIAQIEKKWATTKVKKMEILNHGNLDSVRTWADVRDAVRAYYLMMRKCEPGEVYNIGGNESHTIKEMLDYLLSLSPIRDFVNLVQKVELIRPTDVTMQIPDTSKFEKATGWKPEYTFEQTMQDLLDWWRENV